MIFRKLFLISLVIFFLACAARGQTVVISRAFNPNTDACSDSASTIIVQANPAFGSGKWHRCVTNAYVVVDINSSIVTPLSVQCLGTNDTALLTAINTANLAINLTPSVTCASNNITLTVPVFFNGGLLKPITGQTITLSNPIFPSFPYQCFTNALAGQGTIALPSGAIVRADYFGVNTTAGTTVVTAIVQAAFNSGAGIFKTDSVLRVGAVTIPTTLHEISGTGTFKQDAAGADILTATSATRLVVDGITFQGVAGNSLTSSNNGLVLISSTNVRVTRSKFTGLQYFSVFCQGTTDLVLSGNLVTGVSAGHRFYGCSNVSISDETILSPQYTGFTIAITLDTANGHAFGNNSNFTITNCRVKGYTNGQSILIHDGRNVTIVGCSFTDDLVGVSVNGFLSPDVTDRISVIGNSYTGTLTTGAGGGASNGGFVFAGAASFIITNSVIIGNTSYDGNKVGDIFSQGGIISGYTDNCIIANNTLKHNYGSGIALNNPNTRITVSFNNIADVQNVTDTSNAGIAIASTGNTGDIFGNDIDTATQGIRGYSASTGLRVGPNRITNVTTAYHTPANYTSITVFPSLIQLGESGVLTVATLPTCNAAAAGTWAVISDATAPTYNAALTGGGGVKIPVYCNGTAWSSH